MSSDSKPLCFAGCGEIGTLHCKGCLSAFYCGKVCQAIAWPNHKGPCKEAVKARKAVEEMEAKEKIEATAAAATSSVLCAKGCGKIATVRCPRCLGARDQAAARIAQRAASDSAYSGAAARDMTNDSTVSPEGRDQGLIAVI
jgi:MYND finger